MAVREVDYLLIGGGLASGSCARALREEGAEGSIMLVGRELDPPYERPPCSKGYLRGQESREDTYVRPAGWWDEQQIQLLTRTSVTALDVATRTAVLSSKDEVRFGQALIATGANVRRLSVPGCELEGIHYLRSLANADAIRADSQSAREAVLIGGSYIGCEVAASLTSMGHSCTIIMQEAHTLQRTFGERMGGYFQEILQSHGVRVHGGQELERFEGQGRVARVRCASGLELAADLVVVGAGVSPDVRLAQGAGLEVGELGGARCSSRLATSAPGIYAAGDICEYESVVNGGRRLRVEHWDVALQHGRTVALNMLGRDRPHEVVPYFFSDLSDWSSLEYLGPAYEWDQEILRGSLEQGAFSNWYLEQGRVAGVLSVERSQDLEAARALISSGRALQEGERQALAEPDSELPR